MLRLFEAFAGYGSQRMALRNLGIPFESVGTSEIDGDVILSYAAIHTDFLERRTQCCNLDEKEMRKYLVDLNVPLDYRTFKIRVPSLKGKRLSDMYIANRLIKNYGDISLIDPFKLPDFDLLTYSFPCQDISISGYQKGLDKDSGTRSSLLWECCKIIEAKKPKYLLMENVKNLVGSNHVHNFKKFLDYLASLGYTNEWKVLNARDYGIPQNRERVFCISILNGEPFRFPEPVPLTIHLKDLLVTENLERYELSENQTSDVLILPDFAYCLDSNYWKGTFLKDYLEKRRRQLVTSRITDDNRYRVRRLTPMETWRLMGCSDEDYKKAASVVSHTSLYKQSGNSIVVPVLEAIFRSLFGISNKGELIMNKNEAKRKLIEIFRERVKGKKPDVSGRNTRHDGREGNWLEEQFGKSPDADNHADFWGFELKNETTSGKTTFGDWSANRYIFKTGSYASLFRNPEIGTPQDVFCQVFGKSNPQKNGRYSWSGSPIPHIGRYNDFGQIMQIEPNLDIVIRYSYSKDQRHNKSSIIPLPLQQDNIELARWFGANSPSSRRSDKCLQEKLEDKFNQNGWFTCKKDAYGRYDRICFGSPMNYHSWLKLVSEGTVFFDSGMYQGNGRPYQQWRANNDFWNSLIVECYN